jgi:O-antigen/teichoic acid export membrane protein
MLINDSVKYIPVKLFPGLATFGCLVLAIRGMSSSEYANYSLAISAILVLNQISSLWISSYAANYLPGVDEKEFNDSAQQIALVQLIVGFILFIVTLIVIEIISKNIIFSLVSAFLSVLQVLFSIGLVFLQAQRKISEQRKVNLIQSLSQISLFLIVFKFFKIEPVNFMLAYALSYVLGLSILIKNMNDKILLFGFHTVRLVKKIKIMGKYGIPLCIWAAFFQILISGDRYFLKAHISSIELGKYVATRDLIFGGASFITMPLLMACHPLLAKFWNGSNGKRYVEEMLEASLLILASIFSIAMILIAILSPYVANYVYFENFICERIILLSILGGVYISSSCIYVQKILELSGKTKTMAFVATICLIIFISVNYFFSKNGEKFTSFFSLFILLLYFGITAIISLDYRVVKNFLKMNFKLIVVVIFSYMGADTFWAINDEMVRWFVVLLYLILAILFYIKWSNIFNLIRIKIQNIKFEA